MSQGHLAFELVNTQLAYLTFLLSIIFSSVLKIRRLIIFLFLEIVVVVAQISFDFHFFRHRIHYLCCKKQNKILVICFSPDPPRRILDSLRIRIFWCPPRKNANPIPPLSWRKISQKIKNWFWCRKFIKIVTNLQFVRRNCKHLNLNF